MGKASVRAAAGAIPMPYEYRDPVVATSVRASGYLHGGGTGDAGLQLTLENDRGEVMCVRLPGPTADAWLAQVVDALRSARIAARYYPWGDDSS